MHITLLQYYTFTFHENTFLIPCVSVLVLLNNFSVVYSSSAQAPSNLLYPPCNDNKDCSILFYSILSYLRPPSQYEQMQFWSHKSTYIVLNSHICPTIIESHLPIHWGQFLQYTWRSGFASVRLILVQPDLGVWTSSESCHKADTRTCDISHGCSFGPRGRHSIPCPVNWIYCGSWWRKRAALGKAADRKVGEQVGMVEFNELSCKMVGGEAGTGRCSTSCV